MRKMNCQSWPFADRPTVDVSAVDDATTTYDMKMGGPTDWQTERASRISHGSRQARPISKAFTAPCFWSLVMPQIKD